MTDKTKEAPARSALKLALEALKRMKHYGNTFAYRNHEQNPYEQVCEAIAAIEALALVNEVDQEQPAQPQLTELEKDAANLLFALYDAWPYVHGWCTIERHKQNIIHLMRKHGDFADLYAAQPQQEPLFKPLIDNHPGLAEELKAMDTAQLQQEPVATVTSESGNLNVSMSWWHEPALPVGTKLYTAPPAQRKPLTNEEIENVWERVQANDFHDCVQPFARAIEAAHGIKEKNSD